jgi:uncharacterized protein YqgV (UPF0045/DUF77 family)
MEKTRISPVISCQLTFYPLGTSNVNSAVDLVLEIIKESPVKSKTNELNTIITGSSQEIFELLQRITEVADASGIRYAMQAGISNNCGCKK